MSYLATVNTNLQFVSEDQDWNSLLRYNTSALQVGGIVQSIVSITSGTTVEVNPSGLIKLQSLLLVGSSPIDLSLKTDGTDLFMGLETNVICLVEPTGVIFDHLKIKSTADSTVEVSLGGLFT